RSEIRRARGLSAPPSYSAPPALRPPFLGFQVSTPPVLLTSPPPPHVRSNLDPPPRRSLLPPLPLHRLSRARRLDQRVLRVRFRRAPRAQRHGHRRRLDVGRFLHLDGRHHLLHGT